jgi:hypothetical protein
MSGLNKNLDEIKNECSISAQCAMDKANNHFTVEIVMWLILLISFLNLFIDNNKWISFMGLLIAVTVNISLINTPCQARNNHMITYYQYQKLLTKITDCSYSFNELVAEKNDLMRRDKGCVYCMLFVR